MRDAVIDEIKQRVNIVEVVQEYLPLKKAGMNWKGLCPFHNEKSPSFMVSEDRGMFHCFGCSEHGDIFTFLQKMEGYEFPEVLQLLADRAGVKLERRDPRLAHERNLLAEILDISAKLFRKVLTDSPSADSARSYIEKRGIKNETAQHFLIGFAPEGWETLSQFLLKRGYKEEDIIKSGMALRSSNRPGIYDRFRKRVMFTIRDTHGRVVGFTGRLLPEDEKKPEAGGKYVNSPETPLYKKSEVLYGLDVARHAIKKEDLAVIVEGNMDVVSSHQTGITNVIAASGTALTADQLRLLGRYSQRIAVAFDADAAGNIAARRGIVAALQGGFSVRVITIPSNLGKDPDDLIKKDPALWKQAIAASRDIMDYLLERARSSFDFGSAEGKKQAVAQLMPIVAECGDAVTQAHYVKIIAEALNVPEDILRAQMPSKKAQDSRIKPQEPSQDQTRSSKLATRSSSRTRMLSERLLAVLIRFPQVAKGAEGFDPVVLEGEDLRDLYKTIVTRYSVGETDIRALPDERQADFAATLSLILDHTPAEESAKELAEIINSLVALHRKAERERLEGKIREAERAGDHARAVSLMRDIQNLK